jgi:hypothetical protein
MSGAASFRRLRLPTHIAFTFATRRGHAGGIGRDLFAQFVERRLDGHEAGVQQQQRRSRAADLVVHPQLTGGDLAATYMAR